MTERLTGEERFWIQRFHGCNHVEKALRIIDAQAAVIERVRRYALGSSLRVAEDLEDILRPALAAAPEHTAQKGIDESQREVRMVRPVGRSVLGPQAEGTIRVPSANTVGDVSSVATPEHAAPSKSATGNKPPYSSSGHAIQYASKGSYHVEPYPEHAAPDVTDEWVYSAEYLAEQLAAVNARVAELETDLAEVGSSRFDAEVHEQQANARVAELEGINAHLSADIAAKAFDLRASLARADAAERAHEETKRDANAAWCIEVQLRQRAESEAAALRAVAEAHVKDNVQLGEENAALRAQLEAANKAALESEVRFQEAVRLLGNAEAMNRTQSEDLAAVSESLHAANARADAAELRLIEYRACYAASESEAAALRTERDRLADANLSIKVDLRKAESEAASLREQLTRSEVLSAEWKQTAEEYRISYQAEKDSR